jgi:hypothetical protein
MILVAFGCIRLYYQLTDDFRLANIYYEWPQFSSHHLELSNSERKNVSEILKQKFYYLGKGAQSYAFTSEDQLYVLKFFKFKHLKPNWLISALPSFPPFSQYKQQVVERKKKKFYSVFTGYHLAFQENREGAALLYVHLTPTTDLQQHVTVIDKIGIQREINLDEVAFLLQRRGEQLRVRVRKQLEQAQIEEAQNSFAQILAMYVSEYKRGIYDHDHGVMQNTGFIKDQPFHLDVGKLTRNEAMRKVEVYKDDLALVVWKMGLWIQANYPQYYTALSLHLAHQYHQHTNFFINMTEIDPDIFKKRRHGI